MNSIFKYTENNGEVIITGLKEGVSDTSIVIPETIDGMPVIAIGPWAFRFTSITDIKIGENIRRIEDEAFSHCGKLISVKWNCKCNAIPAYCFFECSNLTRFDFSGIKKIEKYAFSRSGLQEVCLPKNIECISEWTFGGCSELHSVTWNCTCDVIPTRCFSECSNLTYFDFSTIKKTGQYAFWKSGLQEVHLPENIEVVSVGTFSGCSELHSVTWNCTCDVVPAFCFSKCPNLTQFDFSGIKRVEKYAFGESGLKEVNLPENINAVLVGAFEKCGELQSVTWSHKCELIPANCFAYCLKLTKFNFANAKRIGQSAFRNSGLQEVRLPKNIKNIYEAAFYECRKLEFVEWNCQWDAIPDTCFARCSSLKKFDLSNVRKIEERAFIYSGLTSVTLSTETAVGHGCFAFCNDLEKIEWLSDESIEKNIFAECKNIKEILISDKVMNIAVDAFAASPNAEISFV